MTQQSLFSAANLAATVQIPVPPELVPHTDWPFPGLTPNESAQAALVKSPAYFDMLASVIKSKGPGPHTKGQIMAAIPPNWAELCGRFTHAGIDFRDCEQRGIKLTYVPHDDGGLHFTYSVPEEA